MVKYDPNVFEEDSDDEDITEDENEDSDDDFSDDGEEDEDISWQIRSTACKALNSLIPLHLKFIPIEETNAEEVLIKDLVKRYWW